MKPIIRRSLIGALAAIVLVAAIVTVQKKRKGAAQPVVVAAPVERRDIALTIEATGTVEPVDLVEVKSKASGQIIRMPVQVGSVVRSGDLLAQIDTRDVKNQYDQVVASLRAAQAKVDISRAQKKRADELFAERVVTADEHESAVLDFANAQAQLIKARTDVDLAKQRLDDATVRAPISGTVLEQTVANGQVISSATSSASGGTTLLKMADLSRIRLRGLVNETDIGNVRPGQAATVTVQAFPQRSFVGQVEKIEPQAVVQQSVTMFPVLISISNDQRLLLPGMNGEVAMLVDRRVDVPAVPMDAVRSVREVPAAATALGLNPDSVRAQVQRQMETRSAARAAAMRAAGDSSASGTLASGATGRADSTRGRRGGAAPTASGRAVAAACGETRPADSARAAGGGVVAEAAGVVAAAVMAAVSARPRWAAVGAGWAADAAARRSCS